MVRPRRVSKYVPSAAPNRPLIVSLGLPPWRLPDCHYRIQIVGKPSESRFPTPMDRIAGGVRRGPAILPPRSGRRNSERCLDWVAGRFCCVVVAPAATNPTIHMKPMPTAPPPVTGTAWAERRDGGRARERRHDRGRQMLPAAL
jgi:hypothetical protein